METAFDRSRRTVGLVLGPLAFAIVWAWPAGDLSVEASRLMAVLALVVVWWVTEAIPLPATALVGTALTVVCGIAPAGEALAPFASPIIFLFMGSFMIARAISEHGLDARLAHGLLRMPFVAGDQGRMRVAMGGLVLLLSGWMSNTATTAMMLPIVLGILGTAARPARGPASRADTTFRAGFLLTIAYASSIGGIMTPVGTPPNLIMLGFLDRIADIRIDFFRWMLLVAPITLVYGAVLLFFAGRLFPAPRRVAVERPREVRQPTLGRWTTAQRNCAIAFSMAVVLWVAPGVFALTGGDESGPLGTFFSRLDEGVVAILAAGLLFLLPVNWAQRQFTLDWRAASRIDWGTLLLFGGGLSLGQLMFSTGLAAHIGEGIVSASGAQSLWAITAVVTLIAIVLTEITSNAAATNMLVPVVLSICQALDLNPVPPALGACLGASLAFMLPVATPPNAIVYGSGLIPITTMMAFGLFMDVVGFVIIVAGLWLLCPLFGFA